MSVALRFEDDFLKKLEYLHVVSKRAFAGQNRADRLARKRGRGLEFADHRQYSAGDDFRHIDWKAYQRLNRLLLRLFDEEQDLPIYLFLDASRSMVAAGQVRPGAAHRRRRSATSASRISTASRSCRSAPSLHDENGAGPRQGPDLPRLRHARADGDDRRHEPARRLHASSRRGRASSGLAVVDLRFSRSERLRDTA